MRGTTIGKLAVMVAVVAIATSAQAAALDYDAISVAAGSMESIFGTKVAELDAKAYGYSFGGFDDSHRNFNVISSVYVATQAVTINTGDGGTISLSPGDYTFAYTLDYSQQLGGFGQSPVNDFQLLRTVDDQYINMVSNPGPNMAIDQILSGGYNTAAGYAGLTTPPDDISTELVEIPLFEYAEVQFSWPNDGQANPGEMGMVFLFCRNVQVWQVGWGSENGQYVDSVPQRFAIGETGEGGDIFGGGDRASYIPVLVPVVPEPASGLILLMGVSSYFFKKRRQ